MSWLDEFERPHDAVLAMLSSADKHLVFTNLPSDTEVDNNLWFNANTDKEAFTEGSKICPSDIFTLYKVARIGTEEGLG